MGKLFDALTSKYQIFVSEYLVSNNASEAARKAGSKAKNVSQAGKQLLRKAEISAALAEMKEELAESLVVTAERVLKEYARVGFSNIQNVVNGGKLRDLDDLDKDTAAAIQSVKVVAKEVGRGEDVEIEYVHEIRMWPKVPALDAMGKKLGIFKEDNEQKKNDVVIVHDPTDPDATDDGNA